MSSPYLPPGERRLEHLLAGLDPVLDPISYAFCLVPVGKSPPEDSFAVVNEAEGPTAVAAESEVLRAGLVPLFRARRVLLAVESSLAAVGLLARVALALAEGEISCNVISAVHHDHLFVPTDHAERALARLKALARPEPRPESPGPHWVHYDVTVHVDREIAEDWLGWMRGVHVPEVLATGCFDSCEISRLVQPAEADHSGFLLSYRAASLESVAEYQRTCAPALQQDHAERYRGRFSATRVVREEMA